MNANVTHYVQSRESRAQGVETVRTHPVRDSDGTYQPTLQDRQFRVCRHCPHRLQTRRLSAARGRGETLGDAEERSGARIEAHEHPTAVHWTPPAGNRVQGTAFCRFSSFGDEPVNRLQLYRILTVAAIGGPPAQSRMLSGIAISDGCGRPGRNRRGCGDRRKLASLNVGGELDEGGITALETLPGQ